MKKTKKILSILLACAMLVSMLSVSVFAAGTQDDPINAADKWFGYGVDTYLLNPTIAEGNADGMWYALTAEKDGILFLEHSYKNVDYTIYITLNGVTYEGGCVNGEPYNRPIVTAPIQSGDVATIQILTKDAAAGTVYASMNVITGDSDNSVKVKSNGLSFVIGAGEIVYFQDDSLNAIYATKGLLVEGNVANTTFYTVAKNSESGAVSQKGYTDTDADGILEVKLGGSLGGAGAPAVKPAWAIENNSAVDQAYTLTIVDTAHECNWDDDNDTDCNTCGAIRETTTSCQHEYENNCDATCNLCGETRTTEHTYSFDLDDACDVCGETREVEYPLILGGNSISEDVNGLATLFAFTAEGLTMDEHHVANYKNATFGGMKLVSMGAVVCNNYDGEHLPTQEDADGQFVLDIPAKNLFTLDEATGEASFAVRIINIPENFKDADILFVPYVILKDAEGNQYTQYITDWVDISSYNEVLG